MRSPHEDFLWDLRSMEICHETSPKGCTIEPCHGDLTWNVCLGIYQDSSSKGSTMRSSSWTSRSSENNHFPYVFHWLVVACKFRSFFFAKFVRQIWTSLLHDIFTWSICIINTLIPLVLRASPFHVYHTIETHITCVCKINIKITFQKQKWNVRSLGVIFLLTSITCCIDTILFCIDVMHL
jgi:hypothetical protein